MKAVIIGASKEALHTIEKAHDRGLMVTALDGNPEAEGLAAADRAIVVDISNEQAAIEAVRKEQPDFILTAPIGRYLTTIGAANDALKLPGISREMAARCTDKFLFHQSLSEQQLRRCHCYLVSGQGEMVSASGETESVDTLRLSFPCILKPRYGSGSRGIHMIPDRDQLREVLPTISGEEYVLEEWIPGEEYGIDGAVIAGKFYLILLRKKENTPPPVRQAVGYYSVPPTDQFWQQVYDHMERLTNTLGLKECLFHGDLIRGAEEPFVIEVSARPSGHNLHNLFTPLCTGVDMAEEYIKYRMGQPYCFVPKDTAVMLIHYFDMQGKVRQIPTKEQVCGMLAEAGAELCAWECNFREGEELSAVEDGHSLMGRGYFILKGACEEDLKMQAQKVKELFIIS